MLKLILRNDSENAVNLISNVNGTVKSEHYYSGYSDWLRHKFIPSYQRGDSSILTAHCKTYNTLLGFALLKHDTEEFKISNLSPLVDGIGITQALLEGSDFTLTGDYKINIPLEAVNLIKRVKELKFELLEQSYSNDQTKQLTFIKARNLQWI